MENTGTIKEAELSSPNSLHKISWGNYLSKAGDMHSMFINVRKPIAFSKRYLVEINLVFKYEVEESIFHAFYIFLNEDYSVYSWGHREEVVFENIEFCL